jgi:diadenosine tetraphosphate (Ap4A) HIT family hydrolase
VICGCAAPGAATYHQQKHRKYRCELSDLHEAQAILEMRAEPMKLILCSGCDRFQVDPRDLIGSWEHWHIVVNHSQNYLGKVMLVLRRHEIDVTNLTSAEQVELWSLLGRVKSALLGAFQPDHFNYAFLMNLDAHVHMHVIPRYAASQAFAGLTFTDGRIGEHYDLTSRIVPIEVRQAVALVLRGQGLIRGQLRERGLGDASAGE